LDADKEKFMERELWKSLYGIAVKLDKNAGCWKFSNADIVVVYFWCVIHDRPMSWGVRKSNWPDELRPRSLPSQPTLSRRMRRCEAEALMTQIEQTWLAAAEVSRVLIRMIDAKPLAVSGVTKDADAGYGRGAGGMQKGYKFFAVWAGGPLPLAWGLAAMNKSEKTMARQLIPTLPGSGYLLGDPEYDSNALYDLAHAADHQMLVPKRQKHRGIGHRRQSPYRLRSIELMQGAFGKRLYRFRRQIERDFGNLTSFGGGLTCLPAWVRRFPRVRNWLHAKLLINAARWLHNHPDTIAVA
jgi:Transposase DDE domain